MSVAGWSDKYLECAEELLKKTCAATPHIHAYGNFELPEFTRINDEFSPFSLIQLSKCCTSD
jgi:hypothetical protein